MCVSRVRSALLHPDRRRFLSNRAIAKGEGRQRSQMRDGEDADNPLVHSAAIEAADVALMSDDLSKLPWLIRHSRRTLRVIRHNVVLSLGVKAVFVVLTFAGAATLWAGIAADMGVSLIVIANALRLLRSVD